MKANVAYAKQQYLKCEDCIRSLNIVRTDPYADLLPPFLMESVIGVHRGMLEYLTIFSNISANGAHSDVEKMPNQEALQTAMNNATSVAASGADFLNNIRKSKHVPQGKN